MNLLPILSVLKPSQKSLGIASIFKLPTHTSNQKCSLFSPVTTSTSWGILPNLPVFLRESQDFPSKIAMPRPWLPLKITELTTCFSSGKCLRRDIMCGRFHVAGTPWLFLTSSTNLHFKKCQRLLEWQCRRLCTSMCLPETKCCSSTWSLGLTTLLAPIDEIQFNNKVQILRNDMSKKEWVLFYC